MTCAANQTLFPCDGVQYDFEFKFEYLERSDVHVGEWDSAQKKYIDLTEYQAGLASGTYYKWQSDTVIRTVDETGSPKALPAQSFDPTTQSTPATLKIYRTTDIDPLKAIFYAGSSIRAEDLNDNFEQLQFGLQEVTCEVDQFLDSLEGGGSTEIPSVTIWCKKATEGQTVFTGTDDHSNDLNFANGLEFVTVNGSDLSRYEDYSVQNNGKQITLTKAAHKDDEILIKSINNVKVTGTAAIHVGTGPAGNDSNGDLWWDTNSGRLYIYYSPDPDGSSQWVDASPDNQSWVVSVKDFGAVGDGTTDDTAAIQAALSSNYKGIFFPEGMYRVVDTGATFLLTSSVDDRKIFGPGIITATTQVGNVFQLNGDRNEFSLSCDGKRNIAAFVTVTGQDAFIHHCRITSLYSPTGGETVKGIQLELDQDTGAVVSNNYIVDLDSDGDGNFGDGNGMSRAIQLRSSVELKKQVLIVDNYIRNVIGEEGDAISLFSDLTSDGVTRYPINIQVSGNTIHHWSRRGIKVQTAGAIIQNNILSGEWTSDPGFANGAIDITSGSRILVKGNTFRNIQYQPCIKSIYDGDGTSPRSDISIINNYITEIPVFTTTGSPYLMYFRGNTSDSVDVLRYTIQGNVIDCPDFEGFAIGLRQCNGAYVSDNTIILNDAGTPFEFLNLTNYQYSSNLTSGTSDSTGNWVDSSDENNPSFFRHAPIITTASWNAKQARSSNPQNLFLTGAGSSTTSAPLEIMGLNNSAKRTAIIFTANPNAGATADPADTTTAGYIEIEKDAGGIKLIDATVVAPATMSALSTIAPTIQNLNPTQYTIDGVTRAGFNPTELLNVVPQAVGVDEQGNAVGVDQSKLVPYLVKGLQEALTRIQALEANN